MPTLISELRARCSSVRERPLPTCSPHKSDAEEDPAVAVSAGGFNPFSQPLLQLLPAANSLSQGNHYADVMGL
jgi:hypothetical protein